MGLVDKFLEEKYKVIRTGGSLGDKPDDTIYDTKEEAQEAGKRWVKSFGTSKSYYKPGYRVQKVKEGRLNEWTDIEGMRNDYSANSVKSYFKQQLFHPEVEYSSDMKKAMSYVIQHFNESNKQLFTEGNDSFYITAGAAAIALAMAFGIKACNNQVADSTLKKLGCYENYKKYNLDNQENFFHAAGIGDAHSKAMYAAIVANARENGMSIDQSARDLTGNWKKKLSNKFKSVNSTLNQVGGIKSVRVARDPDGTRIAEVIYQYRESHTSGSGENSHTYYTTETGYVYIPMSEANQYGIDHEVDNGHNTVHLGGTTFTYEESVKHHKMGRFNESYNPENKGEALYDAVYELIGLLEELSATFKNRNEIGIGAEAILTDFDNGEIGENMCADLEKLAQDLNEMGLEDEAETIWDAMAPVRQFED